MYQKLKGLSIGDNQMKETQSKIQITSERYPDLFLPVVENHRVSDHFCGYLDSLSADNNPMVLVKLEGLSYRYMGHLYMQWIELMVLCMVSLVWDIKSYPKRLW